MDKKNCCRWSNAPQKGSAHIIMALLSLYCRVKAQSQAAFSAFPFHYRAAHRKGEELPQCPKLNETTAIVPPVHLTFIANRETERQWRGREIELEFLQLTRSWDLCRYKAEFETVEWWEGQQIVQLLRLHPPQEQAVDDSFSVYARP